MAKAGRPKNLRPHQIHLVLPKDTLRYKGKRIYWAMIEMEKKMSRDITSVRMKDYLDVVDAHEKVSNELKKKGYKTGKNGKAEQRIQSEDVAQYDVEAGSSESSTDRSASVVTGISTDNPLT